MRGGAATQTQTRACILTYHRLVEPGDKRSVYDVDWLTFEEHLRCLSERARGVEDHAVALESGRSVCLTFDDGTAEHWGAAERLAVLGLPATFFLISGRIGRDGYLQAPQVAGLTAMGHRVGSHTMTHRRLPLLRAEEMAAELSGSRKVLEDLARTGVDWLAVPGGYFTPACLRTARDAGYRVVRTMEWGYATWPPAAVVGCLPITGRTDGKALRRILDGQAALWPYRAKRLLKRILGEAAYVRLRDRWAAGHHTPYPGVWP